MDLRQLKTFVQVAELGSLSKTSDRLHIAQPALSRQMRLLEQDLQTALFARHGRGMILTEAGVLLLSRARSILQQIEDTRSDLIDQGTNVRGSVALGVPPTVGDVLAARLIEKFHTSYPEVTIRVMPAFSGYLLDFLHRGDVDIAIMYAMEQRINLNLTPLIVEDLYLVGRGDAGLKTTVPFVFNDLSNLTLVLPGPRHGLRVLITKQAKISGVVLRVPIEADALQTLKDLVARGLGYTILPLASVFPEVSSGILTAAPIVSPQLTRKLMLAQPIGKPATNAVRLFAAMLRAEVMDMVRLHAWEGEVTTEQASLGRRGDSAV